MFGFHVLAPISLAAFPLGHWATAGVDAECGGDETPTSEAGPVTTQDDSPHFPGGKTRWVEVMTNFEH